MKHLTHPLVLAVVLGLAACQPPSEPATNGDTTPVQQTSAEDARAEVLAMNDLWDQYYDAGDLDALVSLYAPDAIVVSPEGTFHGRDEILADFQEGFQEGQTGTVTSDRVEVAASGDLAYIYGTWSSTNGYSGTYLSVLGQRDGQWLWLADAYNMLEGPSE